MEVLLNKVNELLVLDCTRADNNEVLTEVVALMVVNDHIAGDHADVVDISKNWLAHHMLSVDVVVDILHECLFGILVCRFKLLPDSVFLEFNMIVVIHAIAEHVTNDRDGMTHVVRETECVVHGVLARSVSIQLGSCVFNLHFELSACSLLSSFEVQML